MNAIAERGFPAGLTTGKARARAGTEKGRPEPPFRGVALDTLCLRVAFTEAGLAGGFRLEDLLCVVGVATFDGGEGALHRGQVLAGDDEFDLGGVEGFTLEQSLGHAVHDVLVGFEDGGGGCVGGVHEAADFGVDLLGGVVGEVARLSDVAAQEDLLFLLAKGHGTELAHAELADHAAGEIGGTLDVVAGTGGHLLAEDFFGAATAHHHGEAGLEVVLGDGVLVLLGEVDRDAERHAARDDRDLVQRVRMLAEGRYEGVAGLVVGGDLQLIRAAEHALALGTHQNLVLGDLEVVHVDRFAVEARGGKGSLVYHVGEIGTGEARCATCQHVEVDVLSHWDLFCVNAEDYFAAADVRAVHDDAAVEAAGTEQGRIEHIGAVGGGDQDNAVVGLKAVHLDQELVEGLLALVVSAAEACATVPADSIDFVDEDDAGGVLLALFEEVANAAGADADEHLDEIRAGDGEEGDVGFAGDGAGEQGLAGARRPDHEDALGDAAAELLEFLGFAEELDDFLELFLGFVDARDVLERDLFLLHAQQAGAVLAEAESLVPAGLHLAHHEEEERENDQDGSDLEQQAEPHVALRIF